jgi:Mn-containing catalase
MLRKLSLREAAMCSPTFQRRWFPAGRDLARGGREGGDGGVVGAVLGGQDTQSAIINAAMNPHHAIVTGGGSAPRDSNGNAWNSGYVVASGNLLANMRFTVTAESQGRLQVARLYQLTEDAGVRDMFSSLLARDTMHQNQWLAAIEELKAEGLEDTPVPSNFPRELEMSSVAYKFQNFSEGQESAVGCSPLRPVGRLPLRTSENCY